MPLSRDKRDGLLLVFATFAKVRVRSMCTSLLIKRSSSCRFLCLYFGEGFVLQYLSSTCSNLPIVGGDALDVGNGVDYSQAGMRLPFQANGGVQNTPYPRFLIHVPPF